MSHVQYDLFSISISIQNWKEQKVLFCEQTQSMSSPNHDPNLTSNESKLSNRGEKVL